MKKGTFLKKRYQKFHLLLPYSIPIPGVLHQNKALYNFRKRGQRSIVERNIGLEYALYSVIIYFFQLSIFLTRKLSHNSYIIELFRLEFLM